MRRTSIVFALLLAACGGDDKVAPTEVVPSDGTLAIAFEAVPYETELSYITDLAFVPGDPGRAIAVDLYGGFELIEVGEERAEVLLHATVDDVFAEFDAGQLAVAIDPDFSDNRFFYLATNTAANRVVVRRYTLDENDGPATVASAQLILEVQVPSSPRWHNISAMGFDEGGVMWMLVGDKGVSLPNQDPMTTVAQDPSNTMGTLVRIAPSVDPNAGGYTVPSSVTPYASEGDPAVVAVGIRSPWKGIYHEGDWIFGDVGLDDIEEVNVIESGGNFGWPIVEGPCELDVHDNAPNCNDFVDPLHHYGRSNSETYVLDDLDAVPTNLRSVYVGWVYQPNDNDRYDGRWDEVLVWGDAYVGFMRATPLDDPTASYHIAHVEFPSAWAQGPDGFVYMTALSELPDAEDPTMVSGLPSPLYRVVLADSGP